MLSMYDIFDEQTWSYILFFVAIVGFILYGMALGFTILSIFGSRFVLYKKEDPIMLGDNVPGVSIIKPLMGIDPLLEVNLESHFKLTYPKFELLLCVQDDQDPAINLVNKLKERFPKVDSKLLIGGQDGVINPMVHNMAPAYSKAQYDNVWVSTSRVKANDEIMMDLVCKLQKPNVALVHQMPFAADQKGFAQCMEKVYFGGAFARYYIAFNMLSLCCTTGMSYMLKKPLLDEVGGLVWYGKYLAEDFFLTHALHEKGYRLVLSSYPCQQNLASASVFGYKDRMVRWLRLRLNMMPFVSGFMEPMVEIIPLALYGSFSLYHFFGINPYIFIGCHFGGWIILDYILMRSVQRGPLPFSKITYLFAWVLRELLAVWIYLEAILRPRTIKWGKRTYKLSLGGHTKVLENKNSNGIVTENKVAIS